MADWLCTGLAVDTEQIVDTELAVDMGQVVGIAYCKTLDIPVDKVLDMVLDMVLGQGMSVGQAWAGDSTESLALGRRDGLLDRKVYFAGPMVDASLADSAIFLMVDLTGCVVEVGLAMFVELPVAGPMAASSYY